MSFCDEQEHKQDCIEKQLTLYAVTDRSWLQEGQTLAGQVELAIQGGVTVVQLREKHADYQTFLEQAKQIKQITDQYNIPLIINDNVEIAAAVDAAGVHVGQSDLEAGKTRQRLGDKKVIGVSAHTVQEAIAAEQAGADYLGVGAMFSTSSKNDTVHVTCETLKAICDAVQIPVVAIGGIDADNIAQLKDSGIVGVAVISAIFAQPDVKAAAQNLAAQWKTLRA